MTKSINVLQSMSLRELVEKINSMGLQKDDIVTVFKEEDTFFLLYYK